MELNASGLLLAQYTAPDAAANSVLVADPSLQIEVTRIIITNTSASPVAASLFQDDSGGASFTTATALMFGKSVPANDYIEIFTQGPNGGIHLKKGGAIGFTDASSGDLTIHIYGMSQPVQGSGRGR
jgi:hypothetical protein